jgi:L-ascorbate metabolism protein UlaG (beta-lactamase superfamily)
MLFDHQGTESTFFEPEASYSDTGDKLPRYQNGRFCNSATSEHPKLSKLPCIMWDFLFGGENRTPNRLPPAVPVHPVHWARAAGNRLEATWLGHSSLLVNIDGYKILMDPVFKKKLSLLGPTRFNGNPPFDPLDIDHVDAVLVSHNHYDHMNRASIHFLADKADHFIVPLCDGELLASWGVPRGKIVELGWWQEFRIDDSLTITATPAQHFSGRNFTDRNESLWSSYAVQAPRHNFFFSGDSGYFDGFRKIGDALGPFDMTFLECGAYDDMWHDLHMFPEETVQAHLDLEGGILHPIHWGTFNLAMHPWNEPMNRLSAAASKAGVTVSTPMVGETTVFGESPRQLRWWDAIYRRH